jgi:hypothetical protein
MGMKQAPHPDNGIIIEINNIKENIRSSIIG